MAIYKNTPPIVTNGLVMYLDAANPQSYTSGSTVWRNTIPDTQYSCSIVGPLQSSTLNGGSVIFSGSTSYGLTNYLPLTPSQSASTYEIVFQPVTGVINAFTGLLGYTGYQQSGFSLGMFPNYIVSQGYSGSAQFFNYIYNINLTKPNVLTAIFGNRTNSYYMNGIFQYTSTYTFDAQYSPIPVRIGNQTQGGWANNNSYIFNVKIYNRALFPAEVTQNYNATKTRFGL